MSDTLVPIKSFYNSIEAELIRQALEQEGIRVFVQGKESSILWGCDNLGEIQFEVLEEDRVRAERALALLDHPSGRRRRRRRLSSQSHRNRRRSAQSPDEKGQSFSSKRRRGAPSGIRLPGKRRAAL